MTDPAAVPLPLLEWDDGPLWFGVDLRDGTLEEHLCVEDPASESARPYVFALHVGDLCPMAREG